MLGLPGGGDDVRVIRAFAAKRGASHLQTGPEFMTLFGDLVQSGCPCKASFEAQLVVLLGRSFKKSGQSFQPMLHTVQE